MSKKDEWKEDPGLYGKRYKEEEWDRGLGPFNKIKVIEYEPRIMTTRGEMTLAQYDRLKERMEEEYNE